jgi:hypothetical protein
MPILSDFTVVNGSSRFLSGGPFVTTFFTGGRHNSDAVLDIAALGGYRDGDAGMTMRVRINGSLVGTIMVHRWQTHDSIVLDRLNVVVPPSRLSPTVANELRIEPQYETTGDYAFLDAVVCHFHQES